MLNHGKVLWKEGMFLQPHHFQASERLQAAHVNARVGALAYGGFQYGFTELEIDRDALLGGNFTISRAAGVFPDGSCFGVNPSSGGLDLLASGKTLSRSFTAYCRPEQQSLDVYLALPIGTAAIGAYADEGRKAPTDSASASELCAEHRYIERTVSVPDELAYGNSKEIEVGEPRYLIRFEGEPLDGCVWLRAARLSRTGSGYMELGRAYSPPTLFTRVSDVLRGAISGLLELLWARIGSLARCRRQSEWGQAFFSPSEENAFRMLNILCTHTPLLSRLSEMPKVHPFDYYTHLTMLYGSLLSFSPTLTLDRIPSFDHDDPAATFTALTESIRESLKVEFWTNCLSLPLEQVNLATWHCRFPEERFATRVNLFIGVSAKVEQKKMLVDVLQRVKVGSRDKLDLLISSSLQGLPLIHVRSIPEGLAAKPEYVYFAVDRSGPLWEGVETSGTLGIHFSGGSYPDMKIELLALKYQG